MKRAREQCDPRARSGLQGFQWSEHDVTLRRNADGAFERVHEGPIRVVAQPKSSTVVPCGTATAVYDESYEVRVHAKGGTEVTPVCTGGLHGAFFEQEIQVTEVLHIFQCAIWEKKTIEMKGQDGKAGNPDDESPMRVSKDLSSASDDFQIRGVAVVAWANTWTDKVVEQTAYSRQIADTNAAVTALSGMALAEAEYGFDGTAPQPDWMWARSWTAHLSRVRSPESGAVTLALVGACEAATSVHVGCLSSGAVLATMASQVVH